ncbi:MAG: hypothetical protein KAH17_10080, partial [Bacteroidales bacterium]|nr:hypothetical protein [Bacteroidales bacterium]
TELGTFPVSSLQPSAQEEFTNSLTLPEDVNTGDYFIIVFVDKENDIEEVSDNNNSSFRSISIRAAYPDLQITHVSANPTETTSGQNINLTATISNIGNRNAGECKLMVSLSEDRSFDSNDLYISEYDIPELAQGEEYSFNDIFSVPDGITPGQYYITFWADGTELIPESNESNNEDYTGLEIQAQEDIKLKSLQLSTDMVKDGDFLDLTFTVENLGILSSPDFYVSLILSETTEIQETDLTLGTVNVLSMLAGEARLLDKTIQIPFGLPEADYYMHAYADPAQLENDNQHDNNLIYRQFSVFNEVDLVPQIVLEKVEYKPGEIVNIAISVTNLESGTANESALQILLSDDTQADLNDEIIDSFSSGTLLAGQTEEFTTAYTIPEGTKPETYYFIAVADYTNLVAESSEQNNQASASFIVLDTSFDKPWINPNSWKVFPNPAQDWISIFHDGTITGKIEVIIRNYAGQSVFKQSLTLGNSNTCRINSRYFPEGFYFIQLRDGFKIWNSTLVVIH